MLVIPISSVLYETFKELAESQRIVFITGLPGVGKSLLIQQLILIAKQAKREVHLLQWDVSRKAFETPDVIAKYPEIDGVTDPAIRKAVGLWARKAVADWNEAHPDPSHILIGELPLIGNRLIELAEVHEDPAEDLLQSSKVRYVIPVPSWEVREVIEQSREKTISNPTHEKEKLDAPPNVLQALWQEVNSLARDIGITKARPDSPYNPYIYGGVYEALLQHRHVTPVLVNVVLKPAASVYETEVELNELAASASEVEQLIGEVESTYTREELIDAVNNWHSIITNAPKPQDEGPELQLPLPSDLMELKGSVALSDDQRMILKSLISMPLDATEEQIVAKVDEVLDVLERDIPHEHVKADVHKFDVYDSYFNVKRTSENAGIVFIAGLLKAYRNVLADIQVPPESLSIMEKPMLRIALETTLHALQVEG